MASPVPEDAVFRPWCEAARRAHDGLWVLWRNMTDLETGLVTAADLRGVAPHRRWVPVAVARKKRDLPDLRRPLRPGERPGEGRDAGRSPVPVPRGSPCR